MTASRRSPLSPCKCATLLLFKIFGKDKEVKSAPGLQVVPQRYADEIPVMDVSPWRQQARRRNLQSANPSRWPPVTIKSGWSDCRSHAALSHDGG